MKKLVAVALAVCVALGCTEPGDSEHSPESPSARTSKSLGEAAPILYSNPFQGSPVRGAPGEPLFVAGDGLTPRTVIYYKRVNGSETPMPPAAPLPTTSTADEGQTTTVSTATAGNGLTILLPTEMQAGAVYALFATVPRWSNFGWLPSAWSNGVLINDARPLWVTPSRNFRRSPAWLPRELKVVGRNLDPMPGASTLVRLVQSDRMAPIVRPTRSIST
jgi:hypothetical protein